MLMERQPPPPIDDDDAEAGCKLMDSFAIFIQLCLAAAAFSTLIIKRQREQPQRPVRIWALDVSKQLVGGIVVHSLNVMASYFSGGSLEGQQANPCVWYFLNILVDTTLGVGILWATLSAFQFVLIYRWQLPGFQSGVYGDPPLQEQLKQWSKQLAVYIASLTIMKLIVVLLFHLCPWLSDLGRWVLGWTMGNYKLQVVFVMLIFPLVMNIIQFWIVDTIVKHKSGKKTIRLSHDEEEAEDMLITDDEDEDDDDARNRFANASRPFLENLAGSSDNFAHTQQHQKIPDTYNHGNETYRSNPKEDALLPSPSISPSPSGHSLHELGSNDARRTP